LCGKVGTMENGPRRNSYNNLIFMGETYFFHRNLLLIDTAVQFWPIGNEPLHKLVQRFLKWYNGRQ